MKTFHIHIEGIVQGVGFRPFVYKLAIKNNIKGWVNNTTDGVHIEFNSDNLSAAEKFLNEILNNLPKLAVVTAYKIYETEHIDFETFEIIESKNENKPKLLLTPDIKICDDCKKELHDSSNRRFGYPFITCTNCGPRYSIIKKLPYDRPNTTMKDFIMCEVCEKEYNNPLERRHFSQTNSCPVCPVKMQLYEKGNYTANFTGLDYIVTQWQKGKIIAIKGIGGYLLTCDATNKKAISLLRERKKRPYKPFALMYPDLKTIESDCFISEEEKTELESNHSPIVLLRLKEKPGTGVALKEINDGLTRLGIMLPYTPLYELLLNKFKKSVIATSGNITDSSIIYEDEKAVNELSKIADIILMNNRGIVIPQDDGVVQFSKLYNKKVVLRRSRGKAPVYINPEIKVTNDTVFTAGSMLKSVFGLLNRGYIYISQYLGNTENFESQETYEKTFSHFEKIFSPEIDTVVTDKHPDYFSTRFGKNVTEKYNCKSVEIQHHKAHFYSVLAENGFLENNNEYILGVIWDGTGLGDDNNIWGGEFFVYKNKKIERIGHIGEFNFILADKMVREPRISALSLAHKNKKALKYLKPAFTQVEFKIYNKLLDKENTLKSTSMGRLFDAVSFLLFNCKKHHYDSQCSMKLENKAAGYFYNNDLNLNDSYLNGQLPDNFSSFIVNTIIDELEKQKEKAFIATKFHLTLVDFIKLKAQELNLKKIAFSGGVFQNTLLIDMIVKFLSEDFDLYFHKEFSPNDEGIPFGQLMYYIDNKQIKQG